MDHANGQLETALPSGNVSLTKTPLCVDLDGTLIATDSLWESLLLLVKQRPFDLLQAPMWLSRGRASFKEQISSRVMVDAGLLPYRQSVLKFIQSERGAGRQVVLVTAASTRIAQAVAEHLQVFDDVIGTRDGANLKGAAKRDELDRRFGKGNYDYIGDATADLPVWQAAQRAYVVATSPGVVSRARTVCTPKEIFEVPPIGRGLRKALRPHQWVKNLLLFIPLILAHRLTDFHKDIQAVVSFCSFSFSASAIYVLNDLLDLESDRRHPRKRNRPFASGVLSAPTGLGLSAGLLGASFLLTIALPWQFAVWLLLYVVVTTLYSFWLKRKLLVDVIVLAGLYTHRIIAGAAAVDVPLTMWLLAFSMFFFLSLAFAKRYSELVQTEDAGEAQIHGRGYEVRDLRIIESIGPCSGYLAVLVFCNYLNDATVTRLYAHPKVLWLVAPILLYWITRIWFIARRRQLNDDPILFAIRDVRSYACGTAAALVVMIASL